MDSEEKKQQDNIPAAAEEENPHCESDSAATLAYYKWAADSSSYKFKIFGDDEEQNDSENQTLVDDEKRGTATIASRRPKRGPIRLAEDETLMRKKKRNTSPCYSSSTPFKNRSLLQIDVGSDSSSPKRVYFDELRSKFNCATRKRSPGKLITHDKKFKLYTCNTTFPTHRALGGHKSSHSYTKMKDDSLEVEKGGPYGQLLRKHSCGICFKSFQSGQALGGHKRKHYEPSNPTSTEQLCQADSDLPRERRRVPLGPNHQADIPECKGVSKSSLDDEKWRMGRCVIPMPDLETSELWRDEVGSDEQCGCEDKGSVRCVRQHVYEAIDKLKGSLGKKSYEELGLSDMGEVVAAKWTMVEEDLFKHVVLTKNEEFWNAMSKAFPDRSKKDIVSSYFNIESDDDDYHEDQDQDQGRGNKKTKQLPALDLNKPPVAEDT